MTDIDWPSDLEAASTLVLNRLHHAITRRDLTGVVRTNVLDYQMMSTVCALLKHRFLDESLIAKIIILDGVGDALSEHGLRLELQRDMASTSVVAVPR